ncbi:hypothetical protein ASPNIDRAFT_134028, partial [Aspergillus niger ATCC 1015]
MGSYTFTWPYNANEVFVTGTFDDWGKTVKLDRVGDVFEKEVPLPVTDEKVHYKFVVDGIWTTDNRAPEEDDGSSNINNVLYPDQILKDSTTPLLNGTAAMAGVTPGSTTAALAAGVPKESSSKHGQNGYYPTISSAAPGSTTAALGQDVPLEQRANVPGSFPVTPASEADKFSVNPIPASSGAGNPIKLNPGEKVPDPSTFNTNTISSTARTDRAGYEQGTSGGFPGSPAYDASAFAIPPVSKNMIPESSLPMGESQGATEPTYTIQSAAPTSTTAGLAAAVPLESQRQTSSGAPTRDVPDVVRQSMSEAHRDPEAATNKEAVDEKKEMEEELRRKVPVDNSTGAPAPTTTAPGSGAGPASERAPRATGGGPASAQISPRATTPTDGPTVTTGTADPTETSGAPTSGASKPAESAPTNNAAATSKPATNNAAGAATNGKEEKKKKKGFFSRLKEKL